MTADDLETHLRALQPSTALVLFETLQALASLIWMLHDHDILRLPEMKAEISYDEPPDPDDADVPW